MRGMKQAEYNLLALVQNHPTHREKAVQIWRLFYQMNICMKFFPVGGAVLLALLSLGMLSGQGVGTEDTAAVIVAGIFATAGYLVTKYLASLICGMIGEQLQTVIDDDESKRILETFRRTDADAESRIGKFLPNTS